jgi:hypothetical protein
MAGSLRVAQTVFGLCVAAGRRSHRSCRVVLLPSWRLDVGGASIAAGAAVILAGLVRAGQLRVPSSALRHA